jgi:hypothetical protein
MPQSQTGHGVTAILQTGRWQRLRSVFHGALDGGAIECAVYIDRACAGDRSLLAEVRVLLEAHEQAGEFLESPVVVTALSISGNSSGATATHATSASREGQAKAGSWR